MQNDEPMQVQDLPSTEASEPAALTGTLVGLVTMVVSGGMFGLDLSTTQRFWIILGLALISPLLTGLIIRFKVVSPKTYDQVTSYFKLLLAEKDSALTEATAAGASQASVTAAAQELLRVLLPQLGSTVATGLATGLATSATQQLPPPPVQDVPPPSPSTPVAPSLPQGYASVQGWPYGSYGAAQPQQPAMAGVSAPSPTPEPTAQDWYDPQRQTSPPLPQGYAAR